MSHAYETWKQYKDSEKRVEEMQDACSYYAVSTDHKTEILFFADLSSIHFHEGGIDIFDTLDDLMENVEKMPTHFWADLLLDTYPSLTRFDALMSELERY
jgi:hypothetical protein